MKRRVKISCDGELLFESLGKIEGGKYLDTVIEGVVPLGTIVSYISKPTSNCISVKEQWEEAVYTYYKCLQTDNYRTVKGLSYWRDDDTFIVTILRRFGKDGVERGIVVLCDSNLSVLKGSIVGIRPTDNTPYFDSVSDFSTINISELVNISFDMLYAYVKYQMGHTNRLCEPILSGIVEDSVTDITWLTFRSIDSSIANKVSLISLFVKELNQGSSNCLFEYGRVFSNDNMFYAQQERKQDCFCTLVDAVGNSVEIELSCRNKLVLPIVRQVGFLQDFFVRYDLWVSHLDDLSMYYADKSCELILHTDAKVIEWRLRCLSEDMDEIKPFESCTFESFSCQLQTKQVLVHNLSCLKPAFSRLYRLVKAQFEREWIARIVFVLESVE